MLSDGVGNCDGVAPTMTGFGVGENSLALFALAAAIVRLMLAQLYLDSFTGRYGVFELTDEASSPKL